jgi:tetratricopeptide (TPR) repeat protein
MKPPVLLLTSTCLAALAAFATVKVFESSPAVNAAPPTEQLRERLTVLEGQIAQLRKDVDSKAGPAAASDTNRISSEEIESAVARWMARGGSKAENGASAVAAEDAARKPEASAVKSDALDAASVFAKLRNSQLTQQERRQLWAKAREAGILDAVVDAFAKNAKENPGNADAQCDYGHALVEKLMTVTDGPEKGTYATAADKAFDKALEADPQHWNARFSKAIGLSFWPPIFNKQGEAITQFETLRKQQEDLGGVKPEYAQTYLFLGNLYQQQGKSEKALEVWKKGSTLFPEDGSLKQASGSAK